MTNAIQSKEELNQLLRSNVPCVILVHAEWCGYCRDFMPMWSKLCKKLSKRCIIRSVEHSVLQDHPILKQGIVRSFPTILGVKDSQYKTFNGERNEGELIPFMMMWKKKIVSKRNKKNGVRMQSPTKKSVSRKKIQRRKTPFRRSAYPTQVKSKRLSVSQRANNQRKSKRRMV